tara:strand:+ start:446 stop:1087 length:642 start_codon:yes stop_codon:yes gene_type:complete
MITRKVNSLGFDLNYQVPASVEEYNGLAPDRVNPCLEDAILSTWYRNGANKFRDKLCDAIEKSSGVKRINAGTDDEPKWENESKFIKRAVAEVATSRGLDPAGKGVAESIRAEWQDAAQKILDGIPFDPKEATREGGSNLVAKMYIEWATKAVANGSATKLAGLLSKALNSDVALTGDTEADTKTLAKAIAANEKRKRDEQNAQSKAEYAIEG